MSTTLQDSPLLSYQASDEVLQTINQIGRTEDIILSADHTRLALAAFLENRIYILDIDFASPEIRITGVRVLVSENLKEPHGVAFLGNDHLVVCNRAENVSVFRIPEASNSGEPIPPIAFISSRGIFSTKVRTPGSVAAYEVASNEYRILVSNDQWHFVSAHKITLGPSVLIEHEGVLLENELQIPDGVSISADHQWIAVSNNTEGEVLIFENTPDLNRMTSAVARLQGVVCPHGLDFDAHGNVYVADAASPYLHFFKMPSDGWKGQHLKSRPILLLERDTFYKARFASREGGIKWLHVHKAKHILMTTHQHGVLEFYDLNRLQECASHVDEEELDAMRLGRDQEMSGSAVLFSRRWSMTQRLRAQLGRIKIKLINFPRQWSAWRNRLRLTFCNRFSRTKIKDASNEVVVSLTAHASQISHAYLAIEYCPRASKTG